VSYNDIITADIRLALLRLLEQDANYSHNEYVLQRALESIGHGISADKLRTELRWLEEQGLVAVTDGSVFVAKLTARGADAALGRARIDGIARPRPGS